MEFFFSPAEREYVFLRGERGGEEGAALWAVEKALNQGNNFLFFSGMRFPSWW